MNNKDITNCLAQSNIINIDSYRSDYEDVTIFVSRNKPDIPAYIFRPHLVRDAVKFFKENFNFKNNSSKILYSVKSNPDHEILQIIKDHGVSNFDVASINEVKLLNSLFKGKANLYFMHPIKSPEAIASSYFDYNIRDYSLDSYDELKKILKATNYATDLNLHIRLAIPCSNSAIELSTKFGILPSKAIDLILEVKKYASKIGICFHVGSQCMDPLEYRKAIMIVGDLIKNHKIKIDILDIGGGFPAIYTTMNPPAMKSYFNEITEALDSININSNCEIWCEPGRSLVAESFSLLVRVEARKGSMLYINDGTYGGLFDAGLPEFCFPVRALRVDNNFAKLDESNLEAFGFYGPTCDSIDHMKGPFYLPRNIKCGDYIEIFQLGSYSKSMRTNFNGFADFIQANVNDQPLISIYDECQNNIDYEKRRTS